MDRDITAKEARQLKFRCVATKYAGFNPCSLAKKHGKVYLCGDKHGRYIPSNSEGSCGFAECRGH